MKAKGNNLYYLMSSIFKAEVEPYILEYDTECPRPRYRVIGSTGKDYYVYLEDGAVSRCDCPNSLYRNTICKHMIKVAMENNLDINALYLRTNVIHK